MYDDQGLSDFRPFLPQFFFYGWLIVMHALKFQMKKQAKCMHY